MDVERPDGTPPASGQALGGVDDHGAALGLWEGAYLHFTGFSDIEVSEHSLRRSFEGTEAMVDEILGWPGPIGWSVGEDPGRRTALRSELAELMSGFGTDDGVELEVPYAVVSGRVPDHAPRGA